MFSDSIVQNFSRGSFFNHSAISRICIDPTLSEGERRLCFFISFLETQKIEALLCNDDITFELFWPPRALSYSPYAHLYPNLVRYAFWEQISSLG